METEPLNLFTWSIHPIVLTALCMLTLAFRGHKHPHIHSEMLQYQLSIVITVMIVLVVVILNVTISMKHAGLFLSHFFVLLTNDNTLCFVEIVVVLHIYRFIISAFTLE